MKTRWQGNLGSESAIKGVLERLFGPFMNNHGEAVLPGSEEAAELGTSEAEGLDTPPATDDSFAPKFDAQPEAAGEESDAEKAGEAEATGTEATETPEAKAAREATEAAAAETPEAKATREAEEAAAATAPDATPTVEELQNTINELQGNADNLQQTADFYMTQYNDAYGTGQPEQSGQAVTQQTGAAPQAGAQTTEASKLEPGALPEGVKAPEAWDNQTDEGNYIDHRANDAAGKIVDAVYQEHIRPSLEYVNKAVPEVQNMVAKLEFLISKMPDSQKHIDEFDTLIKSEMDDLFQHDPDGKVIGVKNQALLGFYKTQANPRKAMLDNAIKRKAPKTIADTVKKTTEATLKKVTKQERGATMIGGAAATKTVDADAAPPQDASPAEVEAWLLKRGLVEK